MYQNQLFSTYPQIYPQPYQDRLSQLQSQYQQAVPQMAQATNSGNQGVLWVQGDAGAKAYMVAPNSTVLLMDSEAQKFYLKSTDASGVPSLRVFEYSEVPNNLSQGSQRAQTDTDGKYVTREEYNEIRAKFKEIMEKIEALQESSKGGAKDE